MSSVLLHSAVPGRKKSILKKPWGRRKVRKHGAGENQLCLGDICKTKKLCALQSSWMRQQPALVPSSVHLLEQIPKKGVQQLCATTRLLPGMKLEAERFSPTPVTLLMMGTGHERSYSSFTWKRNVRSQLAYTSSLLATVQLKERALSSLHFLHLYSPDYWFSAISRTKEKGFSATANFFHREVHTDTLIDWGELWDWQAKYLTKVQKTPPIAVPKVLAPGSLFPNIFP